MRLRTVVVLIALTACSSGPTRPASTSSPAPEPPVVSPPPPPRLRGEVRDQWGQPFPGATVLVTGRIPDRCGPCDYPLPPATTDARGRFDVSPQRSCFDYIVAAGATGCVPSDARRTSGGDVGTFVLAPGHVVVGTVRGADEAWVSLRRPGSTEHPVGARVEGGRFAFEPVREGTYELRAGARGCAEVVRAFFVEGRTPVALDLVLAAEVPVVVTARARGTGTIAGRLVGLDGTGALDLATRDGIVEARDVSAGERLFAFDGLPAGDYVVSVGSWGRRVGAVHVRLGAGERREVTVSASPPVTLTGVVRGRDGRGLEGVVARLRSRHGALELLARTDAHGRFAFDPGLPREGGRWLGGKGSFGLPAGEHELDLDETSRAYLEARLGRRVALAPAIVRAAGELELVVD